MKMGGHHTYEQRSKDLNIGEIVFERFCSQVGFTYHRLGFNEKTGYVNDFFNLNEMIRNIPDYVLETDNGLFVVDVKGTNNIKKEEIDLIPKKIQWYSTPKAPFVYCFCFEGERPKIIYPDKLIKLYEQAGIDKQFGSDKKIYRSLKI